MTKEIKRSAWGFRLYYIFIVLAGLAFFVYLTRGFPTNHWRDIFLFV